MQVLTDFQGKSAVFINPQINFGEVVDAMSQIKSIGRLSSFKTPSSRLRTQQWETAIKMGDQMLIGETYESSVSIYINGKLAKTKKKAKCFIGTPGFPGNWDEKKLSLKSDGKSFDFTIKTAGARTAKGKIVEDKSGMIYVMFDGAIHSNIFEILDACDFFQNIVQVTSGDCCFYSEPAEGDLFLTEES